MNFRRLTQIFNRTRSALLKHEEYSGIGKKKILIVDDNSDLRKLLALVLKNSDYDTVEAATGLEALKQARAIRPNLILLDLVMPVVSGDEVTSMAQGRPIDAPHTRDSNHRLFARPACGSCYRLWRCRNPAISLSI